MRSATFSKPPGGVAPAGAFCCIVSATVFTKSSLGTPLSCAMSAKDLPLLSADFKSSSLIELVRDRRHELRWVGPVARLHGRPTRDRADACDRISPSGNCPGTHFVGGAPR